MDFSGTSKYYVLFRVTVVHVTSVYLWSSLENMGLKEAVLKLFWFMIMVWFGSVCFVSDRTVVQVWFLFHFSVPPHSLAASRTIFHFNPPLPVFWSFFNLS